MPEKLNVKGEAEKRDRRILLLLAALLPVDFTQAARRWDQMVNRPLLRGLLFAEAVDGIEMVRPNTRIFFDRSRVLYGRRAASELVYMRPSAIRRALADYISDTATVFEATARRVAVGDIPLPEWQTAMSQELKVHQAVVTALGAGGVNNLDATDLAITKEKLVYQFERLDRFAGQIEAGEPRADSVQAITKRTGVYATASASTYHAILRNTAVDTMTEEIRILGNAEHCETCIQQAALGWSPIGTLREIGDSECQFNCKCHFDYRQG